MTPPDLETYVRQRYNAVGDNFYPQLEIFNFFFAAQMELARETFCIKGTHTQNTVVSQRAYTRDTSIISIRRVEWNGERIYPNDFLDDDGLTGNNPDETITGRVEAYQEWGDTVYLRPIPNAIATLKMYSYDMPSVVTAVGTLDVPSIYHLDLADYALYCMFAQDKNYQSADYHLGIWNQKKKDAVKTERAKLSGDEFKIVKDMDDLAEPRFF